jgi:ABC-type multidrug transport system fused ATPase/permease subunit
MGLPDGYDSLLGENGVILSGGQKQRLAIARAILKGSKVILLDEATSALDNETQAKISQAIDNLSGDHTLVIVAHRLSTVMNADKIYVVDGGHIVDSGTHRELLEKSAIYRELYAGEAE